MKNNPLEYWKEKFIEVKETGNFKTGQNKENYFHKNYTLDQKIKYIKNMIEKCQKK